MPEPLAAPTPAATSPLPRLCGLIIGLAALVLGVLYGSRQSYPRMPAALTLAVTFPPGIAGENEPLICTGMFREGDLLVVEYVDETTAVLRYDHWGHGGPSSPRIPFRPGVARTLRVEMPSLTTYVKPPSGARAPLRLVLDGRELLHTDVPYNGRQPTQIFFGENPIGASGAREFRGKIHGAGGNLIRGGPESYFTTSQRVLAWLRAKPWQFAAVVLASAGLGLAFAWIVRRRRAHPRPARPPRAPQPARPAPPVRAPSPARFLSPADLQRRRRARWWFVGSLGVALVGYAWLVTLGSFKFAYPEIFGSFYDYQARSFLEGRLDVPNDAIGGEAFEARGKLYGYFGPTPALLRLPFVIFNVHFGGLSRGFMLLFFAASLLAAFLLLRDAVKLTRDGSLDSPAEPSPFAIVVLVASAGYGSTIFFLGSRSLVFHEAILAGIAFALWSAWCALRHLHTPARRWWIGALVCGVLSLHSRPPTGLFALTLLGCVVVALISREWREGAGRVARHLGVGVLCVVGQLTLNGLAYLKFETFDPAPLKISRPYADPGRLAHIDGKSFHLVNLPFNIDTYLLRPNFRIEPRFPWIYMGSNSPRRVFPKSKIDLPDHTLALPYAMPSLFALATLGSLLAAIARPGTRPALAVLWAAVLPITLALFAAIATAQRYTGDFCPFLICAAVFGLAASEALAARWRRAARGLIVLLTVAGIAVTVALTLHYQGEYLWGVPEETRVRYQNLRRHVDTFFGLLPSTSKPPPPIRTDVDR